MNLLSIIIMFFVGFVTWGLVFLRNYALDTRRIWLLSGLVFMDEFVGIMVGVWLARNGHLHDMIIVAIGGTLSAVLVIKFLKYKDN
jgi:hypothetical protein